MTASKLREEILNVKYEALVLPDRGAVEVLPYVSHGAFSAFIQRKEDPPSAFLAMIDKSMAEGSVRGNMTERDFDALARFYARSMECGKEYEAAKREKTVFDAFLAALESTDLWTSYLEDERRLTAQLRWTMMPYVESVTRQMKLLDDSLARFSRELIPPQLFRLPVIEPPVQSALLQIRSDLLLPRIETVTHLARIASSQMDTWRQLTGYHDELRRSVEEFSRSTRWLGQITEQVGHIQRVLDPVPDITRMLGTAAEQFSIRGLSADALANADLALARSMGIIVETNRYFSRQDGVMSPIVRPVLPAEISPEERETFEAAAETTTTAEGVLHDETAGLVVVGGDAARLIVYLLEHRMDERLQPFENILRRLEQASRAGTFLDVLATFAKIAAKDYWKAIWHKLGESFLPNPERVAQAYLGLFLQGHWNNLGFVGREIANGDGYVDLLVHFLGHDHIVELKMLGCAWGIAHAKGGLDQLDAYMSNYERREAFLVVFDGRRTTKGEQLEASYDMPHGKVHVVVVRMYFDAPSK